MKYKKTIIILLVGLASLLYLAAVQAAPTSTRVQNLFVSDLATSAGTRCLKILTNGLVATSTADCGAGGGADLVGFTSSTGIFSSGNLLFAVDGNLVSATNTLQITTSTGLFQYFGLASTTQFRSPSGTITNLRTSDLVSASTTFTGDIHMQQNWKLDNNSQIFFLDPNDKTIHFLEMGTIDKADVLEFFTDNGGATIDLFMTSANNQQFVFPEQSGSFLLVATSTSIGLNQLSFGAGGASLSGSSNLTYATGTGLMVITATTTMNRLIVTSGTIATFNAVGASSTNLQVVTKFIADYSTGSRCARFDADKQLVASSGDCLLGDTVKFTTSTSGSYLSGNFAFFDSDSIFNATNTLNISTSTGVFQYFGLASTTQFISPSSTFTNSIRASYATASRCARFNATNQLVAATGDCADGDTGGAASLGTISTSSAISSLSGNIGFFDDHQKLNATNTLNISTSTGAFQYFGLASSTQFISPSSTFTSSIRASYATASTCARFNTSGNLVSATGDCASGDTNTQDGVGFTSSTFSNFGLTFFSDGNNLSATSSLNLSTSTGVLTINTLLVSSTQAQFTSSTFTSGYFTNIQGTSSTFTNFFSSNLRSSSSTISGFRAATSSAGIFGAITGFETKGFYIGSASSSRPIQAEANKSGYSWFTVPAPLTIRNFTCIHDAPYNVSSSLVFNVSHGTARETTSTTLFSALVNCINTSAVQSFNSYSDNPLAIGEIVSVWINAASTTGALLQMQFTYD